MLSYNWFVLGYCLAIVVISHAKKCPPDDTIHPCHCTELNIADRVNIASVSCHSIRRLRVLKNAIALSLDHPFTRFDLQNVHFNYIPASVLKEKTVKLLFIQFSVLVGLFDQVPEVNHKLQSIEVLESKILRGIEWKYFKNFQNLTKIHFQQTLVRKLDNEFLENVQPSLTELVLINTSISKLDDNVFSRLPNIGSIHITGGKLTTLKRSMFPKENVIGHLSFDENLISSLPEDIFEDMPHLESVSFHRNRLTTISEKIFGNFKEKNIHLHFSENEIECDCAISWVFQLDPEKVTGNCFTPKSLKDKQIFNIQDDLEYCADI